jgi:serine-type D-Ala-D-Ala carboxypeptidase (penicillin-binding protein 5/6)
MLATLVTALAFASSAVACPTASAEPGIQPSGAVGLPDGPAQAWLLADLDSGRILASRDPSAQHAPASTIKPLLAMVVLDNLRPDNFARANKSHTEVECSCVGLEPGQAYTTRQLLEALLMVSGNDAANMLADMLGGQQVAVAAMNRKAAAVGARAPRISPALRARRRHAIATLSSCTANFCAVHECSAHLRRTRAAARGDCSSLHARSIAIQQ